MRRIAIGLAVGTLALVALEPATGYEASRGPTGVLKYDAPSAFNGYTLWAFGTTTYLIDMQGNVVHEWTTPYPAGQVELLEDGNLLYMGQLPGQLPAGQRPVTWGGSSGIVQELDWDGNLVWQYRLATENEVIHHSFHRRANGNTFLVVWKNVGTVNAADRGRTEWLWGPPFCELPCTNPSNGVELGRPAPPNVQGFWPDRIVEVDSDGKEVWTWLAWDRTFAGKDAASFDINFHIGEAFTKGPGGWRTTADFMHINSVGFLEESRQVVLTSREFGEFYLIDYDSGDIDYRWGNPCAYGAGACPGYMNDGSQRLFGPHAALPIAEGSPGAGNILVFNNGWKQPSGNRSRVLEVEVPSGKVVWEYAMNAAQSFYAAEQGMAQRLPNGNTLITSSNQGHLLEVTADKKIVWEYVSPMFATVPQCLFEDQEEVDPASGVAANTMFRAYRYGPDYPGLAGRNLTKGKAFNATCPIAPYKSLLYRGTAKP